ncbi:hypothetical protein D6T51_07600 [Salmonella enterica subsp. enterica serovar Muenchen]|uniref:Uncharacterized protein n=1 Tax=Salmonella enterica subsp. enterica serovar Ank TaxID=1173578 RepID=A0A726YEI2_SALET|nr:hypothetical protein [Salmonella enterica subsp. enterica serovar Muenchen]EBY9279740.1 hypothetical protein [Salmonella enterica subsp. enterica serovar Denver]EJM3644010.1 hypothetical protein [Salmonella enterica]HAE1795863.1 hypothetical protein [Salmonella enterica subsp. enterica serovar Ank]ECD5427494.1 hypothetical protein [Salmonella enterica subsp. enterica serovar Denver]
MNNPERYLQRVMRDTCNPHLPEEIQNACRKKQAFCFGAPDGWLVLKPMLSDGIPYVLVWLGICEGHDSVARYLPEVKTLTRLAGGRWAEFHTARRGFIRLAGRLDFERMADDENGLMVFRINV